MTTRVQGTVKWFSNKKGFGFIAPQSENGTTDDCEDVFVHQSSLKSEGYRTLVEGWVVEFDIVTDSDGKLKADNVTAPGGGPCTGPQRQRRDTNKPSSSDGAPKASEDVAAAAITTTNDTTTSSKKTTTKKPKKQPQSSSTSSGAASKKGKANTTTPQPASSNPSNSTKERAWHAMLSASVKDSLTSKGIRHVTGTLDVSQDKQRIKLGSKGYVSMAHADAILAEGSFVAQEDGAITITWKHALKCVNQEWISAEPGSLALVTQFSLLDETVTAVATTETPATLWGDDKSDPKDALVQNGFQMRRVVLTHQPRTNNKFKSSKEKA